MAMPLLGYLSQSNAWHWLYLSAYSSGLKPPTGYVFLVDPDGAYLTDPDGAYLIEAA